MEPLSPYEIQELMDALGRGMNPLPIGSIWTNPDGTEMYVILHHANLPTSDGPMSCVVLQTLPSGEAWVQPTEGILQGGWQNMGFIWDRGISSNA